MGGAKSLDVYTNAMWVGVAESSAVYQCQGCEDIPKGGGTGYETLTAEKTQTRTADSNTAWHTAWNSRAERGRKKGRNHGDFSAPFMIAARNDNLYTGRNFLFFLYTGNT